MTNSYAAIIVTADEPFGQMSHTQILYAEFLASSYRVIYIQPPSSWQLKHLFGLGFAKNRKEQGVEIIAYRNYLPQVFDRFLNWNEPATEKIVATALSGTEHQTLLLWHFDSYRSALNSGILSKVYQLQRIYHVIDPFYKNPIDRLLCKLCDVLIITSPRNNHYYSAVQHKLINLPQALDLEKTKVYLQGTPHLNLAPNYFVLLGTLSNDLDFDWLNRLVDQLPGPLLLIGKKLPLHTESAFATLCEKSNCHYLGLMQAAEFYPILKQAAAGLIIYNEERRNKVCSPLKAFNYLMAGIPIISNISTEIVELQGTWIHECQSYETLENLCIKAFHKQLELPEAHRERFLQSHTIDKSVQQILEKLHQSIA